MGRQTPEDRILDLILTLLLLPPYILKKIGDLILYLLTLLTKIPLILVKRFFIISNSLLQKVLSSKTAFFTHVKKIQITIPVIKTKESIFPKNFSFKLPPLPHVSFPTFPVQISSFTRYPKQLGKLLFNPLKISARRVKQKNSIKVTRKQSTSLVTPATSRFGGVKFFFYGVLFATIFFFVPYSIYGFVQRLPHPDSLALRDVPATSKIYDRNGTLLYEIYSEQNRTPLALSAIPKKLQEATIAMEDKEFYQHQGISIRGITRAAIMVLRHDSLQGGSTITQQLIKSALLTPERTVTRKIKEIILAFWAERLYSKDQILEMYLNQVPYGGTAWGVEAASETYFGKNVKDLTLAESALLAGLPAAPTLYSPFGAHPEYAKTRQREVLTRMVEDGYISKEEEQRAKDEELVYARQNTPIRAPHFVMYVKDLLEQKYGARTVEQGGLRVTTSLDLPTQMTAEKIVQDNVNQLKSLNVGNGATVITNPTTGDILAMVGSKDYFDISHDGNVNVSLSLRQPGSSIKVVTYALALQKGFTAASLLDDSPITYRSPGQQPYSPVNYDGKFHGKVPLRNALANSYNIPAVKTLSAVGLQNMIDLGKKMGITTWDDTGRFGLSLTLGGGEVTMLDMVKVYGSLANGGTTIGNNPILKVTDYKGHTYEESQKGEVQYALPSSVSFILSDILSDNSARSQAFGPSSALVISGKTVAVKTGTSNDKRDNWAIGYTPSLLAAVWVGNNDNSPMNPLLTSGVTGASPIWHDIMTNLLSGKPNEPFVKPPDVVSLPCYGRNEYFISGTEPKGGCVVIPTLSATPTP